MLAIIDADFIPFICSKDDLAKSLDNVDSMINTIVNKVGADRYILCLSKPPYFRLKYNSDYKGHRKPTELKWINVLKSYIASEYKAFSIQSLEADDLCLILESIEENSIVCSRDKDILKQCKNPYNFFKHTFLDKNTDADRSKFIAYQCLRGDTVDNIKGLAKGFGDVAIEKLFSSNTTSYIETAFKAYINLYPVNGISMFYRAYKQIKIISSLEELYEELGISSINYSENIMEVTKLDGNDTNKSRTIFDV